MVSLEFLSKKIKLEGLLYQEGGTMQYEILRDILIIVISAGAVFAARWKGRVMVASDIRALI